MKKIMLFVVLVPFLLAMQCDPEVEPCGNLINTQKKDLISMENLQTNYNLNDVIWINARLNRNEEFDGENYDLFANDEKFAFYVELKKESVYNENNYLNLNEQTTIIDKGEANGNYFILTKLVNTYQSRTGIKLLEPGIYTVSVYSIGSYNPDRTNCDFTAFSIETDFAGIESNSVSFTVE